jgi:ABC-2 type transport system permease protein
MAEFGRQRALDGFDLLGALAAAYDIGGLLLSSLGGALVPLTALPHWVCDAAPISPGYWAARGLHAALTGNATAVTETCLVLFALALAFNTLASYGLQGRSGRLAAA